MVSPLRNELRRRRVARGWSQADLAGRTALSRAAISAIETRRVVPSTAAARTLTRALACQMANLFHLPAGAVPGAPVWAWQGVQRPLPVRARRRADDPPSGRALRGASVSGTTGIGRWIVGMALAMLIGTPRPTSADEALSASALGRILVKKGLITPEELRQAEAEANQTGTADASRLEAIKAKLPRWLDMVTPFGDLRLRTEGFYQSELPARMRFRVRARLGATFAPSDEVSATVRLATGNPNDPISSNQTLDGTFTRKSINFDWGYLTFKPGRRIGSEPGWLTVTAGKFGINAYRPSELVWDDDVSPEGATETMTLLDHRDGFVRGLRVSGFQWILDEIADGTDPWIPGGRILLETAPSSASSWTVAIADYDYQHIDAVARKFLNPFADPPTDSKANSSFNSQLANSNSVVRDANGTILGYKSGFNVLNVSTALDAADPVGVHLPAGIFGDLAYNTLADGRNLGLYVGAGVGRAGTDWYRDTLRNPGDWGVSYTYAWVEKNSVVSILAFSDINEFSTPAATGTSRATQKGATNLMAHIVRLDYVLLPNLQLTAKAYVENVLERKISNAALTGNPTLVRTQLDAMLRF